MSSQSCDLEDTYINNILNDFCNYYEVPPNTTEKAAQNPCNCAKWVYCNTISSSEDECPIGSDNLHLFWNPCKQECDYRNSIRNCNASCACYYEDDIYNKGSCDIRLVTTSTTATTITTTTSTNAGSSVSTALAISLPIIFVILIMMIIATLWWRGRRKGKTFSQSIFCQEPDHESSSETYKQFNGSTKFVPNKSVRFLENQTSTSNGEMHLSSSIFKRAQIFREENIDISSTLGRGAYGKVYKGFIIYPKYKVETAIKTCTRQTGYEDVEREARVFLKLKERHMNVVNLLGIVIPKTTDLTPMLLLELCEGNLEKYLQKNAEKFKKKDELSREINYIGKFSCEILLKYCYQVCRGMEFLESNKIVHGDLATRNILLHRGKSIAKVSDFGLSRSLYASVEDLASVSSGLPVRWMAPEVLKTRQVTNKSDVWSFGVLMWEIFSLGTVPYPTISTIDLQFIHDLNDGKRSIGEPLYTLSRDRENSDDVRRVRLKALQLHHQYRPLFSELSPQLWNLLKEPSKLEYEGLETTYKSYISDFNASYEQLVNSDEAKITIL